MPAPPPDTANQAWPESSASAERPSTNTYTPGTLIVCKSGYTTSIRPPTSITDREKAANAKSYRYTGSLTQAEFDHFLPLDLGGDPNGRRNLWVEPPSPNHTASQGVSNPKDGVEASLKAMVCHYVKLKSHHQGTATSYLPLSRAQNLIVTNWTTAKAQATKYLVRA